MRRVLHLHRRLAAATPSPPRACARCSASSDAAAAAFAQACERAGPAIAASSDTTLQLRAYSLFKQATVGDAPLTSGAGMFDFKGQAKAKAWAELRGKSTLSAMAAYVALAESVVPGSTAAGATAAASGVGSGGAAGTPPSRGAQLAASASSATGPASAFSTVMRVPMLPPGTFAGSLALVTGGGTGLGRAMATTLSSLGATVCITSRKVRARGARAWVVSPRSVALCVAAASLQTESRHRLSSHPSLAHPNPPHHRRWTSSPPRPLRSRRRRATR